MVKKFGWRRYREITTAQLQALQEKVEALETRMTMLTMQRTTDTESLPAIPADIMSEWFNGQL